MLLRILLLICFSLSSLVLHALPSKRIYLLQNNSVKVWKTLIYPGKAQQLPMHNHAHNRVLLALTDGQLQIIKQSGKGEILTLHKGQAYYLTKNPSNELHSDVNLGSKVIEVVVIELLSD